MIDAKPLYGNNCRIIVYGLGYRNKIGSLQVWAQVGYKLELPPHRVCSWKWKWKDAKDVFFRILDDAAGPCKLVWKLDEAESAPLHLRVEDRCMTVYEDEWETVRFRVRLPKRRSQ